MTKCFIYANICISWQHFVSWHIRLVHKRQFCSQDKILNERLRKLNFQGKSYPCWRIYWAHKQACIGFQVLQSSFSKHIAHAFTLYLFVIVELYSMPSMVLCWCNAKDRACKSGGPHQGNPLGITNCIFAKLRIQFAPFPSFAAGTTDGQGDLNFIQGITKGDILWNSVKGLLGPPSAEQKVPSHYSSPPESWDTIKIRQSTPQNLFCWTQENTLFPSNGTPSMWTLRFPSSFFKISVFLSKWRVHLDLLFPMEKWAN